LLVTGVTANSAAANAGITRGDVIEQVGQTTVTSVAVFTERVNAILKNQTEEEKNVALYVNRKGQRSFIRVTVTQ
jgi:S1-C subfamily serine protease